jgi:hypothetical protein
VPAALDGFEIVSNTSHTLPTMENKNVITANRPTVQALLNSNARHLGEVAAARIQGDLNRLGDNDTAGFTKLMKDITSSVGGVLSAKMTKQSGPTHTA